MKRSSSKRSPLKDNNKFAARLNISLDDQLFNGHHHDRVNEQRGYNTLPSRARQDRMLKESKLPPPDHPPPPIPMMMMMADNATSDYASPKSSF